MAAKAFLCAIGADGAFTGALHLTGAAVLRLAKRVWSVWGGCGMSGAHQRVHEINCLPFASIRGPSTLCGRCLAATVPVISATDSMRWDEGCENDKSEEQERRRRRRRREWGRRKSVLAGAHGRVVFCCACIHARERKNTQILRRQCFASDQKGACYRGERARDPETVREKPKEATVVVRNRQVDRRSLSSRHNAHTKAVPSIHPSI